MSEGLINSILEDINREVNGELTLKVTKGQTVQDHYEVTGRPAMLGKSGFRDTVLNHVKSVLLGMAALQFSTRPYPPKAT